MLVVIFLFRTWGTFWYQNNSDLLKFFYFEFSTPPASVSEAMHDGNACNLYYATSSTNYDVAYDAICLALWRWINFFLSVSPDDYRSCRLIQVFCHKKSFVFFYIIVIRLEAWLKNWLTINLLKKYKIKSNFTFVRWIPNIFHLVGLKHRNFHSCWALMKILMFSTHSMEFVCACIHLKKVNILYVHCIVSVVIKLCLSSSQIPTQYVDYFCSRNEH